tara:strand:- start:203 stop:409 length:207 start_codon:yes stop_codon:yes gene_type:complete
MMRLFAQGLHPSIHFYGCTIVLCGFFTIRMLANGDILRIIIDFQIASYAAVVQNTKSLPELKGSHLLR